MKKEILAENVKKVILIYTVIYLIKIELFLKYISKYFEAC